MNQLWNYQEMSIKKLYVIIDGIHYRCIFLNKVFGMQLLHDKNYEYMTITIEHLHEISKNFEICFHKNEFYFSNINKKFKEITSQEAHNILRTKKFNNSFEK